MIVIHRKADRLDLVKIVAGDAHFADGSVVYVGTVPDGVVFYRDQSSGEFGWVDPSSPSVSVEDVPVAPIAPVVAPTPDVADTPAEGAV